MLLLASSRFHTTASWASLCILLVSASYARSDSARLLYTSVYGKGWRVGGLEIGLPDSARFVSVGCSRAAALERGVCIQVHFNSGSPVSSILNVLDDSLPVIGLECELSFLIFSSWPTPFLSSSLPPPSSLSLAAPEFLNMIRRS